MINFIQVAYRCSERPFGSKVKCIDCQGQDLFSRLGSKVGSEIQILNMKCGYFGKMDILKGQRSNKVINIFSIAR